MNKIFSSKYFRMIVAAALTAVTISACDKTAEPEADLIKIVGNGIVKIGAEAADVTVQYSVSGAASEAVSVSTNADWLTVAEDEAVKSVETAPASKRLKAAANMTSASRTAVVSLSMRGAKTARVTVIQSTGTDYITPSGITFDLSTTDVTESSVFYTVAPNLQDRYYVMAFIHADEWNEYDGNRKAYVDKAVAEMKEVARKYEEKYEAPFNLAGKLYKGYRSTTQNGLDPDTDYCLIAFDLSLSWSYSGNVAVTRFKTGTVPPSSDAFSISYDESSYVVTFNASKGISGKFCYGFAPVDTWNSAKTPRELVRRYIEAEGSSKIPTYDTKETDYAKSLPFNSYANVGDNSDWVAFVYSYNASTGTASNIAWLQFHFQMK